jgi:hypothetical protein
MFPHMRTKTKIKRKTHKLLEVLECRCCMIVRSIALVGVLDHIRGRTCKTEKKRTSSLARLSDFAHHCSAAVRFDHIAAEQN